MTTLELLKHVSQLQMEAAASTPTRNKLIRQAFSEGVSQAKLARVTGLTRQRISQLCDYREGNYDA